MTDYTNDRFYSFRKEMEPFRKPHSIPNLAYERLRRPFDTVLGGNPYFKFGEIELDNNFDPMVWLENNKIDPSTPFGNEILMYGYSQEAADKRLEIKLRQDRLDEDLAESSFLTNMVTDPLVLAEVFLGLAAPRLISGGLKLASKASTVGRGGRSFTNRWGPVHTWTGMQTTLREFGAVAGVFEGMRAIGTLSEGASSGEAMLEASGKAVVDFGIAMATVMALGGAVGSFRTSVADQRSMAAAVRSAIRNAEEIDAAVSAVAPATGRGVSYLASPTFTESWAFKAVPTPSKSIYTSKYVPDTVKDMMARLTGDAGLLFQKNLSDLSRGFRGEVSSSSVLLDSGVSANQAINRFHTEAMRAWGMDSGVGAAQPWGLPISNAAAIVGKRFGKGWEPFDDFKNRVVEMYIKKEPGSTEAEQAMIDLLDRTFKEQDRLNQTFLSDFWSQYDETIQGLDATIGNKTRMIDAVRETYERSTRRWLDSTERKLAGFAPDQAMTKKQLKFWEDLTARARLLRSTLDDLENINTVDDFISRYQDFDLTSSQLKLVDDVADEISSLRARVDELTQMRTEQSVGTEPFWPRILDKNAIQQDKDTWIRLNFEAARRGANTYFYSKDPEVLQASNTPASPFNHPVRVYWRDLPDQMLMRRLRRATEDALSGRYDEVAGVPPTSAHMMRRVFPASNSELINFISTDVRGVVQSYIMGMSRKREFSKAFGKFVTDEATNVTRWVQPSWDDLADMVRTEMRGANAPAKEIERAVKNFRESYEMVVSRVRTSPDTWDVKIAEALKTLTQWTYLGAAGIAALADFSHIFMNNKMETTVKGLISMADDFDLKMNRQELLWAGELTEPIKQTAHMRYYDNTSSNPVRNNWTDTVNNIYYKFNGLETVTQIAKEMSGAAYGHTIIDSIEKVYGSGQARSMKDLDWMQTFLNRYMIDEDIARRILAMPYEKSRNGFIRPNTKDWTDEEALYVFRRALSTNVTNTVIMASAADKPYFSQGSLYVRMKYAKHFGLKESAEVPGYAKYENALLSLPLTFYSYTLGALNKITANTIQGGSRQPALHFAISIFFGYQIYKMKTPRWQEDQHSYRDKALRAFDFSGLAALYSDLTFRMIDSSASYGVELPVKPKFKSEPWEVPLQVGGAPVEWTASVMHAVSQLARGNLEEGWKGVVYQTPGLGNILLRDTRRSIANAFDE